MSAPVIADARPRCRCRKLAGRKLSTQAGFGDILAEIGRGQGELKELADAHRHHQPGRHGLDQSRALGEPARRVRPPHPQRRVPRRQARQRAALGHDARRASTSNSASPSRTCSCCWARPAWRHALHGARLLPIGTVYDPFVNRGLDALIYACYQDARFLLVSTPSGITLAPEGGQHQSINTPLIGMAADRLASYEPAHVDELAILLRHAFDHMQAPDGSAVWLRLSTRQIDAAGPHARPRSGDRRRPLGGAAGARARASRSPTRAPVAPEAEAAFAELARRGAGRRPAGDHQPRPPARRLARGRARRAAPATRGAASHIETHPGAAGARRRAGHACSTAIRRRMPGSAPCAASAWCRSGPDRFGQSGDIPDLYREYGIDTDAILDACAQALLG